MWGNRLGWTISLLIVLAAAGMLVLIVRGPGLTEPTTFSREPRHFAALPAFDGSAVMGEVSSAGSSAGGSAGRGTGAGTGAATQPSGDAGALYREAIALYLADRARYDDFAALGRLDSGRAKRLPAIDKLVAARGSTSAALFADAPHEVIGYAHTKPPIEALRVLGRVLVDRLALLNQRAGRTNEARRYADAALALGLHLCNERIAYAELEVGLELLGKSTAVLILLAEAAGDSGRVAALKAFDRQRIQLVKERIDPVLRVVRSIDAKVVGTHAGDVFELARRAQERMWRVEAILALGRLRFFAGDGATASDQRAATRLVTELAERPTDPIVRAAAIAARDLTAEGHGVQ